MNRWRHEKYIIIILVLIGTLFSVSGCDRVRKPSSVNNHVSAARMLFVGNSYTYGNNGVDNIINGLAGSTIASRAVHGGYFLHDHVEDAATINAIQADNWKYVVLQGQSQEPIDNYGNFSAYAAKLDEIIRSVGGKTILFMTWERQDNVNSGVTTDKLATAYTRLGKTLNARVAPVGLAFARALRERPGLSLTNANDGSHPTVAGTYLAGCVIYATAYGTPEGNPYSDGLSDDDKAFLQRIAIQATNDYISQNLWLSAIN
jgi:hypothetical protein